MVDMNGIYSESVTSYKSIANERDNINDNLDSRRPHPLKYRLISSEVYTVLSDEQYG